MATAALHSISHVTLHNGKTEHYDENAISPDMYQHILGLFPLTIDKNGIDIEFDTNTYHIETQYDNSGGITKIYVKLKNPTWAKAHLLTCGYSNNDYYIFNQIIKEKIGERHIIITPQLPYLISRIEPGIIMDQPALQWLTPFARAIALVALDTKNYLQFIKKKQQS